MRAPAAGASAARRSDPTTAPVYTGQSRRPRGSPSSRGLGFSPFKAKTRVRIPLGTPLPHSTPVQPVPAAPIIIGSLADPASRSFQPHSPAPTRTWYSPWDLNVGWVRDGEADPRESARLDGSRPVRRRRHAAPRRVTSGTEELGAADHHRRPPTRSRPGRVAGGLPRNGPRPRFRQPSRRRRRPQSLGRPTEDQDADV